MLQAEGINFSALQELARKIAETDWLTLPQKLRKPLTTEAQARRVAEEHAHLQLGVAEDWARDGLPEEARQAFRDSFVAAFLDAWQHQLQGRSHLAVYHLRSEIPPDLAGKTQLREEGYRLLEMAQPVALFRSMQGAFPLYRREDTVSVTPRKRKR